MASWNDVRRIASALPGTSEVASRGSAQWRVDHKNFAWERPLHRTDLAALGEDAPQGPIIGVRVADLGVKESLLASAPDVYFTIPHFDGYPAVLVLLDRIEAAELDELMVEAWLDRAPKRLAKAYREQHPNVS
jgi:hypothetical protein